jgi:antitoxin FitA
MIALQSFIRDAIRSVIRKEATLASITVRNIDDGVKQALRIQAAAQSRSMEEHVRRLLTDAARPDRQRPEGKPPSVVEEIAAIMQAAGGGIMLEPYPDKPINFDRLERRSNPMKSVE